MPTRSYPIRPHYAIYPVRLSVCPVPAINLTTENHTTFKLRREATHIRSNWQSNCEVQGQRPHIVSASGAVLACYFIPNVYVNISKLLIFHSVKNSRTYDRCFLKLFSINYFFSFY